jgi:uncharacterized protein (DUF697 family)
MTDTVIEGTTTETPAVDKQATARGLIKYYSAWSFGAGIVPLPVLDVLLVIGVNAQMLRKMSATYGVPFSENVAKTLIASLLSGVVPGALSFGIVGYALRAVPAVGQILGVLVMPAFSSAATYAIGRVFLQHYESGGTLLNFNPDAMREHFRKEFEAAKSGATA